MTEAWGIVIAAAVTGIFGLAGLAIKEFRNMRIKNSEDHGAVMLKLDNVEKGVQHVSERLDDHIDWHLKK